MAETPELGTDFIADLPLPAVVEWPIFPFKGDIAVRTVRPFAAEDEPRSGEPGGSPCHCSGESDYDSPPAIWQNDRWLVRPIPFGGDRSPFPAYMLETVEHMDLDDFDDAMAADLGVMTLRLERAMRAADNVGRVHINRWGDGGSHFHLWFLGRPRGAGQLRGFALPYWGFILPDRSEAAQAASDASISAALASY